MPRIVCVRPRPAKYIRGHWSTPSPLSPGDVGEGDGSDEYEGLPPPPRPPFTKRPRGVRQWETESVKFISGFSLPPWGKKGAGDQDEREFSPRPTKSRESNPLSREDGRGVVPSPAANQPRIGGEGALSAPPRDGGRIVRDV